MNRPTVIVYDFDGTITSKDSFLQFLFHAKGTLRTYLGLLWCGPIMLGYKLKLIPNGKAKQMVFSHFFKGMSETQFNTHCKSFIPKINQITRPNILKTLQQDIANNHQVLIISASITNWITPWSETQGIPAVLGTELSIKNNSLTGKFATPNCYGQEKVKRLLEKFPNRDQYTLVVHGDSAGDKELLEMADQTFYY